MQSRGGRASPVSDHLNEEKRPCGGSFRFSSTGTFPNERSCNICGRIETYERNQILVLIKPGVTDSTIKEFCRKVIRASFYAQKSPHLDDPATDRLYQILVAASAQLKAVLITIPGIGIKKNPEAELSEFSGNEYDWIIEWITRKPVATDRSGKVIQY